MKAIVGSVGWLEAEWSEGQAHEAERPARTRRALTRRAGVRAPIVASKPGNSGGAKGCRKVET